MKLLFLLISINFAFIIFGDPEVKHFYIENNRNKCALFDLSSDIDIIYLTKYGLNLTNINMSPAQEDQSGMCNNGTNAVFNISINQNLNAFINFNFINTNQLVSLSSIQFGCMLSNNSYFPGVIDTGYISLIHHTNISLSKATNFYQCKSKFKIPLSENVTLNFYFTKLKMFNVVDSSFGDGMDECQEDFNNLTTISTTQTTSLTSTSEAKTTESTVTTSTHLTTKSTPSKSTISTSHISTSHTSLFPSTSSASSTSHSSTVTSTITKSFSSSSSTHLSSISTKVTTSVPISTTVNPQKTFLYAVKTDKETCLLIESIIDTNITYKSESKVFYFSNTSFSGDCSPNIDTITITSVPDVNLTMIFTKKETNSILTEIKLIYLLSNKTFPSYVGPGIFVNKTKSLDELKVDTSKGYVCKKFTIPLDNLTVEFQSFHYEAFRTGNTLDFKKETTDCVTVANSIVAIVVGVVLAVFLVIIVVVFLILRYRANKRKGYEEI